MKFESLSPLPPKIEIESQEKLLALSKSFEDAGIIRKWKLRDMIFDLDIEDKKLNGLTPVDWERTKFDLDKINSAKSKLSRIKN